MKQRAFVSLCIPLCLSVWISCVKKTNSDCNTSTEDNLDLSADNRLNAYSGFDTLVFVSNGGDTARLYGKGKQTYRNALTRIGNYNSCNERSTYTTYYENLQLVFEGGHHQLSQISFHCYRGNQNYPGEFRGFTVNGDSTEDYWIEEFRNHCLEETSDTSCYDQRQIKINGYRYNCFYSPGMPHVYYNAMYGIMRIDSIAGKTWNLVVK